MFVGDDEVEGLGAFIVDGSGKIVARAYGVRMLAPGYSLRHGVASKNYVPPNAVTRYQKFMAKHPGVHGWESYGSHASYSPVGQLPMRAVAADALRSSSGRLSGWQYGAHASFTPGMGQLPMRTVAADALRSSSGRLSGEGMFGWQYGAHASFTPGMGQLPMKTVAQDALRSSSGQISGFGDGDEDLADMFGPEGDASALF